MSVSISVSERGSLLFLEVSGRVDAFSDKRIFHSLRMAVEAAQVQGQAVILGLEKCEFLSLWALKNLMVWSAELEKIGSRLILMSPSEATRRQVELFIGHELEIFYNWSDFEIQDFYRRARSLESAINKAEILKPSGD